MHAVTPNHAVNFRHFDYAKPKYLKPKIGRKEKIAIALNLVLFAGLIIKLLA